jgi:hypothetical protein
MTTKRFVEIVFLACALLFPIALKYNQNDINFRSIRHHIFNTVGYRITFALPRLYMNHWEATRIIDGIYLGDIFDIYNTHKLSELGISTIVNIGKTFIEPKEYHYNKMFSIKSFDSDIFLYNSRTCNQTRVREIETFLSEKTGTNILIISTENDALSILVAQIYVLQLNDQKRPLVDYGTCIDCKKTPMDILSVKEYFEILDPWFKIPRKYELGCILPWLRKKQN